MKDQTADALVDIAESLETVCISPNEYDRNGESANVVDGLFAIARGLHRVADAIEKLSDRDDPAQVEE